jgi:hypothetical protein
MKYFHLILYFCLALCQVGTWCLGYSTISESEMEKLDSSIADFMALPVDVTWSVVEKVSPEFPMLFLHQRKAGGMSIRYSIENASKQNGLSSFIPCLGLGPVDCVTYTMSGNHHHSFYAGHFPWQDTSVLLRHGVRSLSDISCVTNFREPVSRIVSCIYFRFKEKYHKTQTCINEMSLAVLQRFLWAKDIYGNSCLNEPFRVLSGVRSEAQLDHLEDNYFVGSADDEMPNPELAHTLKRQKSSKSKLAKKKKFDKSSPTSLFPGFGNRKNSSALASKHAWWGSSKHLPTSRALLGVESVNVFSNTLRHIAKCSPLVLELPLSYELASRRYPYFFSRSFRFFEADVRENVARAKCAAPSNKHAELIARFSELETVLYNAVYQKVQSAINATFFP